MRYNLIRKMDIADGPGVRVSIFVQGCEFHCKNCFNKETWDFSKGKEFTDEVIARILELAEPEYIQSLSILGGEPLHPKNIDGTIKLAKAFREKFPDKDIWIWTGFLYENIVNKDILNYVDVIVDGQYQEELHDFRLKYRGSSNQRVIDVPKSVKKDKVCLIDEAMQIS